MDKKVIDELEALFTDDDWWVDEPIIFEKLELTTERLILPSAEEAEALDKKFWKYDRYALRYWDSYNPLVKTEPSFRSRWRKEHDVPGMPFPDFHKLGAMSRHGMYEELRKVMDKVDSRTGQTATELWVEHFPRVYLEATGFKITDSDALSIIALRTWKSTYGIMKEAPVRHKVVEMLRGQGYSWENGTVQDETEEVDGYIVKGESRFPVSIKNEGALSATSINNFRTGGGSRTPKRKPVYYIGFAEPDHTDITVKQIMPGEEIRTVIANGEKQQ